MLSTPPKGTKKSIPWQAYTLAGATSFLIAAVYVAVHTFWSARIDLGPAPIEAMAFAALGLVLIVVGTLRRIRDRT